MAGRKTDYHKHAVLNLMRGTNITAFTPYAGLLSAAPSDTSDGTEVAVGSYARQSITFNAPSGGSMSNSADVTFPTATADYPNLEGVGIWDASSGGNLRYWYAFPSPIGGPSIGQNAVISAGQCIVTEDLD